MMNVQSVKKASLEWELINRWIERYLGDGDVPYLKLSYSRFTENPVLSVNQILVFIDEKELRNPINDDKSIIINPSPSISGNPMRFSDTPTVIQEDIRWKHDMSFNKRVLSDLYGILA